MATMNTQYIILYNQYHKAKNDYYSIKKSYTIMSNQARDEIQKINDTIYATYRSYLNVDKRRIALEEFCINRLDSIVYMSLSSDEQEQYLNETQVISNYLNHCPESDYRTNILYKKVMEQLVISIRKLHRTMYVLITKKNTIMKYIDEKRHAYDDAKISFHMAEDQLCDYVEQNSISDVNW